jgi:hypothetical protein
MSIHTRMCVSTRAPLARCRRIRGGAEAAGSKIEQKISKKIVFIHTRFLLWSQEVELQQQRRGGWGGHLLFHPSQALAVSFISAGCRFFTCPSPCAPLRLSSCSASRQPAQRLRTAYPAAFQHPTPPESTLPCRSTPWSTYPTTAFFLTCTLTLLFRFALCLSSQPRPPSPPLPCCCCCCCCFSP